MLAKSGKRCDVTFCTPRAGENSCTYTRFIFNNLHIYTDCRGGSAPAKSDITSPLSGVKLLKTLKNHVMSASDITLTSHDITSPGRAGVPRG
jgi:hypothetical protein